VLNIFVNNDDDHLRNHVLTQRFLHRSSC
jgi:hypothetical protein